MRNWTKTFVTSAKHKQAQWLAVFVVVYAFNVSASAAPPSDWSRMQSIVPRNYVCYRAAGPIKVDGKLSEAEWKHAPWSADFVDIEGDAKPKPRFQTRAKMLWDDTYFYIAAKLIEPHVWGTLIKHDSVIFHDNDYEVFIDPDGDNHQYYEFEMNALNTGWDLRLTKPYKNGGKAKNEWEIPGLKTAVYIDGTLNDPSDTDRFWSVEIAIPWKVLREYANRPSPPLHGDTWRVNFSRVQWRHDIKDGKYKKRPKLREDNWVWSPQGIIDMHRPERWGYVQFSWRTKNTDSFESDGLHPAREALMTIYHHQKARFKKEKTWAGSLAELDLKSDTLTALLGPSTELPRMTKTPNGFTAQLNLPGGQLRIDQDSHLTLHPLALRGELIKVLAKQTAAWNEGNIDAFMETYWKSNQLTFSSGGRTTRGWQATKDRYKRKYSDRDKMGHLSFSRIEVTPVGEDGALMLGRWFLTRKAANLDGNFSLILKKIKGRWVIVHDHSSLAE